MTATITDVEQRFDRACSEEIESIHRLMDAHFRHPKNGQRARQYIQDLLAGVRANPPERFAGVMAVDARALVTRGRWDADALRDDLRQYVMGRLGSPEGVIVVSEVVFRRRGKTVVGVARQPNRETGRMAKSQVGMFLSYAGAGGVALIDRELYLPPEWALDRLRRRVAGVPDGRPFLSKAMLVQHMLERALFSPAPVAWVTGGATIGSDHQLREWLECRKQPYLVSVPATLRVSRNDGAEMASLESIVATPEMLDWVQLACDDELISQWDWARVCLSPHDDSDLAHWLLVSRRHDDPAEVRCDMGYGPKGISLETLARLHLLRGKSEQALEAARGEVQLGNFRVRRWDGWYRHMTLALVGLAVLSVVRARARAGTPSRTTSPPVVSKVPRVAEAQPIVRLVRERADPSEIPGTPVPLPHASLQSMAVAGVPGARAGVHAVSATRGAQLKAFTKDTWPPRDRGLTTRKTLSLVAAVYMLALAVAETVTAFVDPATGVTLHVGILLAMLACVGRATTPGPYAFLLPLMLPPLIRIVSLGLPLDGFSRIWWYSLPAVPLFAASIVVIRALSLTRHDVGLRLPALSHWIPTLLVGCSGFALGYVEYQILRPEGLVSSTTLAALAFPVAAIVIGSGLLEELIFRGILQGTAQRIFNARTSIVFVSSIFAILHIGHISLLDVTFVFGVGIYFGIVVQRTGSILGVVLAHSVANVTLLVILPQVGV